ncbi:hypothetical protein Tco_0277081 [Tanacetum coccineum]
MDNIRSRTSRFSPSSRKEVLLDPKQCSGNLTGGEDKLSDFKEFKGGYVAFGNDSKGGRISGKRTIKPASTPIEAHKSLGKDEEGEDVDVHWSVRINTYKIYIIY